MVYCFTKLAVCKWAVKSITYSLLNLSCYVMIVLGILLVPSSSQAFQKGDKVVAQNRGPWGKVIVRLDHWVSDPWAANIEGRVSNGTRGTIQDGPERGNDLSGNELVWYKVKWRTADGNLEGWSAETVSIGDCKVIGLAAVADQRDKIVLKLFDMSRQQVADHTLHDYNGYGCDPNQTCGYQGGHSGLDVLSSLTNKKEFRSLTAGELIWDGDDVSNTIAVYDSVTKRTTLYLHASDVLVSLPEDREIRVGKPLGIQGRAGNATGDHVHLEVREGKATLGSCGARIGLPPNGSPRNINPIPYLYRWAIGARKKQFLPWDVNHDGKVNQRDKSLVKANRRKNNPQYDVNCDGVVDNKDVDDVHDHIGDPVPAAPTNFTHNQIENITIRAGKVYIGNTILSQEMIQELLDVVRETDDGSLVFKHKIALLESLLVKMIPAKTELLANYPNPFNPETWIPYQLATPAEVKVAIYAADGTLVRTLVLGHQAAGVYQSKGRAAYWDGTNALGEPVASGVYFYTLTAGDFRATRKLLIRK